jgi:hypothetical protein
MGRHSFHYPRQPTKYFKIALSLYLLSEVRVNIRSELSLSTDIPTDISTLIII